MLKKNNRDILDKDHTSIINCLILFIAILAISVTGIAYSITLNLNSSDKSPSVIHEERISL